MTRRRVRLRGWTARRRAPVRWLFSALSILCSFCLQAEAAVDDYIGRPIGTVRLLIEGRDTTDPVLTQVVETVVGQPLSMVQVRESAAHLFSLGRFEDVQVDATLEGGRVALRYDLIPIHPVTRIRFAGQLNAPGVDASALRRAVVDRYGVSPPLGRVADMTRIITDALRERGYLHPTISPRPEVEHTPERATLVFTVDPGGRTTIGDVEIIGRPTVSLAKFLDRLGLTKGAPYQPETLNARIEKYIAERRTDGYYEAKIMPLVTFADNELVANVTLTVTPGPHVRVVFTGDPLPGDKREELVPVEREGSVDEDLLEDSSNRIEEALKAQGYRAATAPHTRQEANGELVITFAVTRGQQYRVSTFDISGNASVPLADFASTLRVKAGQPFSESRLDADVSTIEEVYRRRGFASVHVTPDVETVSATPPPAQVPVAVRVEIVEGARTIVDGVTFTGQLAISDATLRGRIGLQAGSPYVPGQLAVDRDAIQLAYQDLGYESATVEAQPQFSQNDTHVSVAFTIQEGPQVFVDHVLVVGNVSTSTETIERELHVKPGDPFSASAITDGQRRLMALGLFRRAKITELSHGAETARDLLVTIEEAPPTTIGYGGGLEGALRVIRSAAGGGTAAERFEVAPRASFEIGRRNLFGKNRSVNLYTSLSLHEKDSPVFGAQAVTNVDGGYGLTEYRVVGAYREPRLFDTVADAFVNVTFEQQIRSSFTFRRDSASLQIARRLSRSVSVTGSYQIQRTELLSVNVDATDPLFPLIGILFSKEPLRLSTVSASVVDDTRNDALNPTSGMYLSANGGLTAQAIGSQVGFAKSVLTAQAFHLLAHANGAVLAGSARLGLATEFNADNPIPEPERFFAGGDSTVRGFALDDLGVRHTPPDVQHDTIDQDGFPIGGNGLVIFNAEIRAPVWRGLALVGFVDTGNVFARTADISFGELRTAVGGGIRYKSPVGPLRIDLGFKIHRQASDLGGLTAWFVSFGQAF